MRMRHIVICCRPRSTKVFPHYLINGTNIEKKLLDKKCVFWISLQLLSETFFILRITERDMIKNVHRSSCEVPLITIIVRLLWKSNLLNNVFEKYSNVKFHENPSSGSRVVTCGQTDGRTDRDDEADISFSQFCENPSFKILKGFMKLCEGGTLVPKYFLFDPWNSVC
jgi:hypothetical protein